MVEMYKIALSDQRSGIICAERPQDGAIVGSIIVDNQDSRLAEFILALKDTNKLARGSSYLIFSRSAVTRASLL